MRKHINAMGLLAVALALAATCAQATVVTVSPTNMNGWTIVTNNDATAEMAAYGPAVFERVNPWIANDGTNLGTGAFYCTLDDHYDGTPSSAWLGLDTFNGTSMAGVALSHITKLEFYSYMAHIPTATSPSGQGAGWESWKGWWKEPRQPITIQLTAQDPATGTRKQFWFMPLGLASTAHPDYIRGDNSGQNCLRWLRYDAITFNYPGPGMSGKWYSPENPEQSFDTWAALIAAYGTWTLVPTSTTAYPAGWKSPGWDDVTVPPGRPTCTATGKCFNFEIGGRKTLTHIFYNDNITWENDYQNGKSYMDHFTLGIDGVNVTYDFEPAAGTLPPKIVSINNKTAYDSLIHQPTVQQRQLVKICGKVVDRLNGMFKIDDGTGRVVEAIIFDNQTALNPAGLGEYWSAWGYLEKPVFEISTGPQVIWTIPEHMQFFY